MQFHKHVLIKVATTDTSVHMTNHIKANNKTHSLLSRHGAKRDNRQRENLFIDNTDREKISYMLVCSGFYSPN